MRISVPVEQIDQKLRRSEAEAVQRVSVRVEALQCCFPDLCPGSEVLLRLLRVFGKRVAR